MLDTIQFRIFCPNICYVKDEKLILPVVLCGCKTWSYTLRGEDILRVFKNSVLRKTFGSEMKEVTWKVDKTANEELHGFFYSLPRIISVIKSRSKR